MNHGISCANQFYCFILLRYQTFGQLSKYTSAMYAEMPPNEKEAWNQRAEADKARYLHELANYTPPTGYDNKGDALATHSSTTAPTKRRGGGAPKNTRDPNAPKRSELLC